MNRHYETWTIEEYEHAKELRAKGLTYHQIGEKMGGLSSAAIFGRLSRASYARTVAMTREFDQYELDKMRDMRYRGMSLREIGEYFECDPDVISNRLKLMGVIRRDYLESEIRLKIRELREEGLPCPEIARQLDLTSAEVRYAITWMRRHGEL